MKNENLEIKEINSYTLLKQDIDNCNKLNSQETFRMIEMYKSDKISKENKRKIRKAIIEGNVTLVDNVCQSILRKYSDYPLQYEELFSYGSECLINCLEKFDSKRKTYFSSFASLVIYRHLLSIINKTKLEHTNSYNVNTFYNTIDMEEEINRKNRNRVISEVLNTLNKAEKRVIIRIYGLDDGNTHTQKEVGNEIGISGPRVSQIHKKALRKLRKPKRSDRLKEFY